MAAPESDFQSLPPTEGPSNPAPPTGIKRQFLWNMAPLLVTSAVNIVSVPLFYRYLGAEMYALWFYVASLSGTFGFMDLGLGTAMGRYIGVALGAGDKTAVRQYRGTGNLMAIPVLLVMTGVFMGVGIFLGPKWFQVKPENVRLLQWAFLAGGCNLLVGYYAQFWLLLSQAHFDFKFIGQLRSVFNALQISTSLCLAYLTGNPVAIISAGALFGLAQLGFFVRHARRNYQLGFDLRDASTARAREMFGISSKVLGTVLVNALGGNADRLLLGRLAPPFAFANYNVCCNFGTRIQGLSFTLMGPVFHQTSRAIGKGKRDSAAAIYNETFDFTFGLYALAAVWVVIWHPVFLRLWLGRELAQQVAPAFVPLVIAFCLSSIALISTAQLAPLNRVGVELGFNIVNSICLGSFTVAGWRWGGLGGVAWGVLASRVVVVAQDLYVIRMIGGGGWLALRTWRRLLAQCAIGAVFIGVSRFRSWPFPWEVVLAALHGSTVAVWLYRRELRKVLLGRK